MKNRNCFKLAESAMENIVMLRNRGLTCRKIGELLNLGASTVSRVSAIYNAAVDGDVEYLIRQSESYPSAVAFACHKVGIDVPTAKQIAIEEEPKPEAKPESKAPDNTVAAFTALLDAVNKLAQAVVAIDARLEKVDSALQKQNVMIPDCIKALMETVNINGDIMSKEYERIYELLK